MPRLNKDRLTLMIDLRNKGLTYSQIGTLWSVSKQAIQQELSGYYTNPGLSFAGIQKRLNISYSTFRRCLEVLDITRIAQYISWSEFYRLEHYINKNRICPNCKGKKKIPSQYCSFCWQEYRWQLSSKEAKQSMALATKKWMKKHPEANKEIQRKAVNAWQQRKKLFNIKRK